MGMYVAYHSEHIRIVLAHVWLLMKQTLARKVPVVCHVGDTTCCHEELPQSNWPRNGRAESRQWQDSIRKTKVEDSKLQLLPHMRRADRAEEPMRPFTPAKS